jgi:hypothetical protein
MSSPSDHVFSACLDRLAQADRWTYRAGVESAAEPAAWAAAALAGYGDVKAASRPAAWLGSLQQDDGSVGISAAEKEPRWPTSLAMLAWVLVDAATGDRRFEANIQRAARWSLAERGKTTPRSPQIGHDTTIIGWSWAADTACWLEPTCFYVLGLAAAGYADHPRVADGLRLITDRLLLEGGANYGNTVVLGQPLLPHLEPTGVALVALAGHSTTDLRVARSITYLQENIDPSTAPASLSWACLGLAAHNRRPLLADDWLAAAIENSVWQPTSACEQSLLLLAAKPAILCPAPLPV